MAENLQQHLSLWYVWWEFHKAGSQPADLTLMCRLVLTVTWQLIWSLFPSATASGSSFQQQLTPPSAASWSID